LLILATFLTNCSSIKQLSIFKEEVKRQELNLDRPTPLQLEQIKWIIITSENASEVFKKMEEQGLDPVVIWSNR
jgi:uroporphyrinogen-III synthase